MTLLRALPLLALATPAFAVEVELTPGADIRALTQSMAAGDTFIFDDGTYEITAEWSITGIGTEDSPITLRAKPGTNPVVRLTTEGRWVLNVDQSEHIKIQGLTLETDDERYEAGTNGLRIANSSNITFEDGAIRHVGSTGVSIAGDNSGLAILRSEISDTRDGSGLYAGCGDASCWMQTSTIEGNLIHDIKGRDEYRSDGIHLPSGAQGNIVRDNVIFAVNRNGIVTSSTEYGAQNEVEGNVVFNATYGSGLVISGAALVRNNLVFDVAGHGLYSENNRDALENLVISFNTFATTGNAAVRLNDWAGRSGMVFANNALVNPAGVAFYAEPNDLGPEREVEEALLIRSNAVTGQVYTLDFEAGHFIYGGGYTDFEDWTNWDYYPSRSSILRAAGDPSGATFVPALDFNGFERNGEAPTIGAYEFVSGGNPGWVVQEDFKSFEDTRVDPNESGGGCCKKDADGTEVAFVLPLLGLGLLGARRRRR